MEKNALPRLQYKGSEQQKLTLHLFFQIMGKIRMSCSPRKNHWWYITLYVDTKGFTTGPVPYKNGFETFTLLLNLHNQRLEVFTSGGEEAYFDIFEGITVAEFYRQLKNILKRFGIETEILEKPFDLNIDKGFRELEEISSFDREYVQRYWKVMLWASNVFKDFSGRFYGKTCPVHLYWHSMDLAVTRFSGKRAPKMPSEARISDKDAYSHECISFGFWPGDPNIPEPAFYSYTFPAPDGIEKTDLKPKQAKWVENKGNWLAILPYRDLQEVEEPATVLLDFLESAYQAGARLKGWDFEDLKVPPLKDL
ncbi:DUF5996 family protein [Salinimicrobium sediminilitoris]|uniref:DUF5996 family protein n=1 Tax=Salinimicrobium sediminilitoris TaxID=2876715 RepID=UPI001E532D8E|nr:DUF5996 family protein [Salinimicrobium sediminilitoris]MCC8359421.1 DUF5996 family protein [Salinimicrobium sediminilitoris]